MTQPASPANPAPDASKNPPLEIVLYPDKALEKPCRALAPEELKAGVADGWILPELIERMKTTMYAAEGIGLAAPQVGVPLRLFIADIKDERGARVVINPVLSDKQGSVLEEEGCLSIPGVRAKVKRFARLKISGLDAAGNPLSFDAAELLARVCQHENDHLDGILFINKIGMTARLMIRKRLRELEEDYRLKKLKKKK